ncbi:hypothetical protein QBC39DRAFT_398808 [Podospora conica]|nr:hypothetical protein QBC39DRAFT_398808 [Schizothecium conicum]
MFDLPDAKRVRREDLFTSPSPSSSRSSSPTPKPTTPSPQEEADLKSRLARLVALPPLTNANDNDVSMPDADPEEEFEFRLFSTSAPTQHINLAEEVHHGPAMSQRPVEFYVRGELTEEEKARFRAAAVSGEEVKIGAQGRAWGLEVPWRVVRVVGAGGKKGRGKVDGAGERGDGGKVDQAGAGEAKGRKKPNKKRRIAMRIKLKAIKEEEAKKMSKEEHLKEKKKRLNREKKLKRRQKEKEKKKAAGQGGGDADGDMSSDDESE